MTSEAAVSDQLNLPVVRLGPRWAISDAWMMVKRNLIRMLRSPDWLTGATIQPILFVLLFAYVFGGSIALGDYPYSYRQFLMAGIFIQTIIFGSAFATTVGMADDLKKGLIDRFRSLPMTRSALLVGRTLSDIITNSFTLLIMLSVGFAIGFRFHGGILRGLAAVLLGLLFGFAFSWVAAWIGLMVRSVEAAQSLGLIWLFPLTFASSAFVDPERMPSWLQGFVDVNPVSVTVNASRALFDGMPVGNDVWYSLAWSVGIIAVFAPLAVNVYRRRVSN